jgi:hypothetical protein
LKEHRKAEAQERELAQVKEIVSCQQNELRATIARQQKQIEALTATVQKVSEKLELTKAAPQLVTNR